MHHLPESRDPTNPLLESALKGREEIIASLMSMNARYEKLLNDVQVVMEVLVDTLKRQGKEHKEVSLFLFYKLDTEAERQCEICDASYHKTLSQNVSLPLNFIVSCVTCVVSFCGVRLPVSIYFNLACVTFNSSGRDVHPTAL